MAKKKTKSKSWKTTIIGVITMLGAICVAGKAFLDNDPGTVVNYEELLAAIMTGLVALGFLAARDNDKSSEDVGAK